jgi:TetR/AcrR family transcriptional regulator, transcriptional repressor for nem operon
MFKMRGMGMLSAIAEGGIIVSKVIKDKKALSQQLILYRDFIRAVFLGT